MFHTHDKYEAVPIVLLGNKSDLEQQRQVRVKDGIKVSLVFHSIARIFPYKSNHRIVHPIL